MVKEYVAIRRIKNMLNKLNILNQKIVNNELWDPDYLKQIDIDELLD